MFAGGRGGGSSLPGGEGEGAGGGRGATHGGEGLAFRPSHLGKEMRGGGEPGIRGFQISNVKCMRLGGWGALSAARHVFPKCGCFY